MKIIPGVDLGRDPLARSVSRLKTEARGRSRSRWRRRSQRPRRAPAPPRRPDRGLLAEDPHLRLDPGQHQRVDEGARTVVLEATDQRLGAAAIESSTCARRVSTRSGRASGPTWVAGVGRVTDNQRTDRRGSLVSNSSAIDSATMKRFAEMQAWPALMLRARVPSLTARSISASSRTTMGRSRRAPSPRLQLAPGERRDLEPAGRSRSG